jgi:hypothetical protein
LSTTVYLHTLKHKYTFDKETVACRKIKSVSYKENIKNVAVHHISELIDYEHITKIILHCETPIKKNMLPSSLTHFTFGYSFNQKLNLGVLPSSLTHLTFDRLFNRPIGPGVLPCSLTHLTFGHWFNQPIGKNVLPSSLTHLTFGFGFDKSIEQDILPSSLTHLYLNSSYPLEFREKIPSFLLVAY